MDREELVQEIVEISGGLAIAEQQVRQFRNHRDQLFVTAYDGRKISVTEMGKLSGLRRESVHDAINRIKTREEG